MQSNHVDPGTVDFHLLNADGTFGPPDEESDSSYTYIRVEPNEGTIDFHWVESDHININATFYGDLHERDKRDLHAFGNGHGGW